MAIWCPLVIVSVKLYEVLPLRFDASLLHDMMNSIFPWRTSFTGAFARLINNCCGSMFVVSNVGVVAGRQPCHFGAACCWAVTIHSLNILCSVSVLNDFYGLDVVEMTLYGPKAR